MNYSALYVLTVKSAPNNVRCASICFDDHKIQVNYYYIMTKYRRLAGNTCSVSGIEVAGVVTAGIIASGIETS